MYDHKMKTKWDNEAIMDYAKKEAEETGLKNGVELGVEKGIALGIEKGRLEEARAIARDLKKEGLSIEFIAKTTKLSVDEIKEL